MAQKIEISHSIHISFLLLFFSPSLPSLPDQCEKIGRQLNGRRYLIGPRPTRRRGRGRAQYSTILQLAEAEPINFFNTHLHCLHTEQLTFFYLFYYFYYYCLFLFSFPYCRGGDSGLQHFRFRSSLIAWSTVTVERWPRVTLKVLGIDLKWENAAQNLGLLAHPTYARNNS